ncbi:hypothetical protein F5148DRAFT_1176145 [Russula earlei]|uniref:Uncharacterized protein n=1 Tax=Russula earlei TaxID=71964 RepID=A0ACC0UGZ3_9AGAM|nr:hypothetical protein F5148DRAFT_1176145 [Russula earlei]
MSYNYYRYAPGWGTHQFQIGAPPLPAYQPLPSYDHSGATHSDYYHNTISRLSSGMGGFGKHEARMWHRRAYAGLGEVTRMMPQEIGAAAAYEAYRQFLYSDYERQREALRALAIAEAVSLWQDTGRAVDQYGLQMACDEAAATATNIITERELDDGYGMGFGGSHRSRRNSFNAYPFPVTPVLVDTQAVHSRQCIWYGGGSPLMMAGIFRPARSAAPCLCRVRNSLEFRTQARLEWVCRCTVDMQAHTAHGYDYLGAAVYSLPEDHHRHRHRHRHRRHRHRSHDRY